MGIIRHYMASSECYWQISKISGTREIRLNSTPMSDDIIILTKNNQNTDGSCDIYAAMKAITADGYIVSGNVNDVIHFDGKRITQPVNYNTVFFSDTACNNFDDLKQHSMECDAIDGGDKGVGVYAEKILFPQWLNESNFAYFRIDQERSQLAERLLIAEARGKRPDFMVYRPGQHGIYLVDVKCLRYSQNDGSGRWRIDRDEMNRHKHFGPSMCYAIYDRTEVEAFALWVLGRASEAPIPQPRFLPWSQVHRSLERTHEDHARFDRAETYEQISIAP